MAELSFCKQFLTTLDSRPAKLSSDYIADPKKHPAQPAYILPKLPNPKRKRGAAAPAGDGASSAPTSNTISVTLTPHRTPPAPLTISVEPTASVHDLKVAFAKHVGLGEAGVSKVKVLKDKRPVGDVKSVGELSKDAKTLALGIMVLGGIPAQPVAEKTVAEGKFGADVMKDEAFWEDLKGFLSQRVKDQATSEKAVKIWKKAWEQGAR
ncbi:hypothetical protein P152DRAFT_433920 [Eremomyces bilateralis CBS 781.70]|uniref:Ubiquitin-like domain-containing protein n=1 Tax=Eremomyces bilateralis CBS 781.70 TaxID=1392243 RepID=A0A6G1G4X9_9PEZI|nr:uncharacterized protein P152DRAFT_433920 [Eremomyces bilateralis CBS 781.70]KAF1813127.1 hypothetical protein P152DRAFT_433920 [Eremomyces bilateralis CBS 781.70]